MGLHDTIQRDWAVLKRAPMAFTGLLVAGLVLGFTAGQMWSARQVAIAEGLTRMKEAELAAFIQKQADKDAAADLFDKFKLAPNPKSITQDQKPEYDPNAPIKLGNEKKSADTWDKTIVPMPAE